MIARMRRRSRTGRRRPGLADSGLADRGSVALELTVLTPGLLLLIALVIVAGRVSLAGTAVDGAARDASRQASIARTAPVAAREASAAATATLARQGLQCAAMEVTVDTAGFRAPVGSPASTSATVSCTVRLSDVGFPGLPGTRTVSASFTSPLDRYRARR